MKSYKLIPLCLVFLLAGCLEEKPKAEKSEAGLVTDAATRTPIEKLSFAELKAVVEGCQKSGKIVTDNYCKEAAYVFERKDLEKREQDRLARAKKEKYEGKVPVPSF
ncbi:hypothetical protein EGT07_23735 [Herbaspirillum sp. HC18]|nr:hypothetical protein EGT07_23735 [Herbaspirillum sp. HC18]